MSCVLRLHFGLMIRRLTTLTSAGRPTDDRQAIAARSFEIEAADSETTIPDYKHNLFSGPRKLSTDGHADTVANGCERTRVENFFSDL